MSDVLPITGGGMTGVYRVSNGVGSAPTWETFPSALRARDAAPEQRLVTIHGMPVWVSVTPDGALDARSEVLIHGQPAATVADLESLVRTSFWAAGGGAFAAVLVLLAARAFIKLWRRQRYENAKRMYAAAEAKKRADDGPFRPDHHAGSPTDLIGKPLPKVGVRPLRELLRTIKGGGTNNTGPR